ncbi:MAG: PglZ domain-containing protein [Anaerolineae bacterium]
MTVRALPATTQEYLLQQLSQLDPRARLVFVLDPESRLLLSESVSVGKEWQVVTYRGDDLAFRATMGGSKPTLIWVRPALLDASPSPLVLSSLPDLVSRADAILDLSLNGVLQHIAPQETWPEGPLLEHGAVLARHLPRVATGLKSLRKELPRGAALDAVVVRALALHCLQPVFGAEAYLFNQDSAIGVLEQYLGLAWGADWEPAALVLLRQQARLAPKVLMHSVEPWLAAPTDALARYLYLYRLLTSAQLPGVTSHLRGLGAVGLDPEPLEAHVGDALRRWQQDVAWRRRVIAQAEGTLSPGDLQRVCALLTHASEERALQIVQQAELPGAAYELASSLIATCKTESELQDLALRWPQHRPSPVEEWPATGYASQANALLGILDRLAAIYQHLGSPIPAWNDLAGALDWYTGSGAYALRLQHAEAAAATRSLPDGPARTQLRLWLPVLAKRIGTHLDEADQRLASIIRADLAAYLGSPRLATRLVRELRPRTKANLTASLWIVVLDGMRWDTWAQVVKPRLQEMYEIKQEKAYLSLLPSCTHIARTGLLAGQIPSHWKSYGGSYTTQQSILAARALEIPEAEQRTSLRFASRMEADRATEPIDAAKRFRYNVVIFNLTDDNVHHLPAGIDNINKVVGQLLDDILAMLAVWIGSEDTLIIASDHGFTELDPGAAQVVPDDARWRRLIDGGRHPVTYRYLSVAEVPSGLQPTVPVRYSGVPEGEYVVAVGQRWFQRADSRGPGARYAHGGLSFAEMVVPGALLQPIKQKRLQVALQELPAEVVAQEGEELVVVVVIGNTGNQRAAFEFSARASTDPTAHVTRGELQAGEKRAITLRSRAVYRQHGGSTDRIHLSLSFGEVGGALGRPHVRELPVRVLPQKGKVELSFGGLDDL